MWHVSSRSGVATSLTAIHLLLTYLHTAAAPLLLTAVHRHLLVITAAWAEEIFSDWLATDI